MDPAIAATLIGVLGTGLIGVLAGAFHLLRSDLKELRIENRTDLQEFRTENRTDLQEFRTEYRTDLQESRTEYRTGLQELRAENRADHRETNARIDRLEGKVDMLIAALARAGFLVDPQSPASATDPEA